MNFLMYIGGCAHVEEAECANRRSNIPRPHLKKVSGAYQFYHWVPTINEMTLTQDIF